ncbi:MAG: hypothetical protein KTR30_03475 [Saprospiraceae bacterium]|nr:hypothetical protein [Saprospiraceae bacterium]
MTQFGKYLVILFGLFLIGVGILMLWRPAKARAYLKQAGSTNLINYAEITIRMIPAAGLVLSAELSQFPEIFKLLGWFMIATSIVLYFVPRRIHHAYALWCADMLTPGYIRLLAPASFLFGGAVLYAIL